MTFRLGLVELAPDTTGGAATYGRAMRHILTHMASELGFELIRLVNETSQSSISGIDESVVRYQKWSPSLSPFGRLLSKVRKGPPRSHERLLPQVLASESIDLVWFLAPNQVIEQVRDIPFVMTVWDLAHREVQGFPEFNSGRGWAQRESWYTQNIGRAFHVVTDSTHTGKSLERIYGLYPHNWSAVGLPFPPEIAIDESRANEIGSPYFYYPASFWPHKNHKVLIDALALLEDTQPCLVFTGTNEGMEDTLKGYAREKGLESRVKFLGRVTDAEVQGLISQSLGVLMPSMLGPTNYPPLEALRLGVPSVVSTAHHFDEIPAGALVEIEPGNAEQWAKEMTRLSRSPGHVPALDAGNKSSQAKVHRILESFQKTHQVMRLG